MSAARSPTDPAGRSLVLVAGSGRSGTSVLSGILQRLGYTVAQPEVPADETNPRGFGESQWVVDFHARLLRSARVQTSDARPAAWAATAEIALDPAVRGELTSWLAQQLDEAGHLVVKDPRLSWFLPLWRRCAEDLGEAPRFVTMLRHPGAVVDSKQRSYGGRQGEAGRAAGWLHQSLYTERATRESPRAFVLYEDLLEDWPRAVARIGEALDLRPVRDAPATAQRSVHEFVDRGLRRSRADWGSVELPAALRAQADEAWTLLSRLAGDEAGADAGDGATSERLDALRAAYGRLYRDAEAIAQSSIAAERAERAAAATAPGLAVRVARRVPARHRRRVPVRVRAQIARTLRA